MPFIAQVFYKNRSRKGVAADDCVFAHFRYLSNSHIQHSLRTFEETALTDAFRIPNDPDGLCPRKLTHKGGGSQGDTLGGSQRGQ